jgi:hypothetical protein
LRRPGHNRSDTIHRDANTRLGAVGDKTRLSARGGNLGAGMLGHRLNGRRLSGYRLRGLCQRKTERPSEKKTNYAQRYSSAHDAPLIPEYVPTLPMMSLISAAFNVIKGGGKRRAGIR